MAGGLTLRAGSLNNSGLWQGSTTLDALSNGDLTQSSTGRALSGGDLLLGAATLNTAGTLQGKCSDHCRKLAKPGIAVEHRRSHRRD